MKRFILVFAVLVLSFSNASAFGNKSFNRLRTYDVQHYVIRLEFDRARKTVFGDSTIELKPLAANLQEVELDAADLSVDSVTLEGSSVNLGYVSSKTKLTIKLDRIYPQEETISIRIKYSAKPKRGIYFVDPYKVKGKEVRSAQIWTQGESEETRHWLPSFDFPDDKATTEQILKVNKGETAIANGLLVNSSQNPDGTTTFHYKMPLPHSLYLTSFVIGKYERVTDRYKEIPLSYYVYPGQQSIVPLAYGKTKDMFRVFEDLTGVDYPYNKYDQTMVADFQFGGMENITATTMGDSDIFLARSRFGREIVEDLVAHELAHSWFGNLVTCRNWAELWLNEGFATFMEAAFREKMYDRANYIKKINQDAAEYFAYDASPDSSKHGLFNTTADPSDDDTMFDTITYQKGSVVIHMLREEIGEEAFWKSLNLYLNRFRFKNVETPDLIEVVEEVSGRDLKWFFDQWVYKSGYPRLRVLQSYDNARKQLKLSVSQTHPAVNGTPSVFNLPLEVTVRTAKGEKTEQILIDKRQQVFEIKLSGKPVRVIFDKNNKVPLKSIRTS